MRLNLPILIVAAFVLAACATASEQAADSGSGGAAEAATTTQAAPEPQVARVTGPEPGSQADLIANVGDRVFFGFDKFSLEAEARASVERWSAWLKTYPNVTVTLEGHADERGTREYNLALAERRANASREYMISLGIDPNRLKIVSFGKERPAVIGSSETAYSQNRRSVMVVN